MNLKYVVALRHGEYGCDGLTDHGKRQAEDLATKIQKLTEGLPVVLFSSPVKRATQMGEIIAQKLSIQNQTCDRLKEDGFGAGRTSLLLSAVICLERLLPSDTLKLRLA
jgi:broad specificity phosphatase PhoE